MKTVILNPERKIMSAKTEITDQEFVENIVKAIVDSFSSASLGGVDFSGRSSVSPSGLTILRLIRDSFRAPKTRRSERIALAVRPSRPMTLPISSWLTVN